VVVDLELELEEDDDEDEGEEEGEKKPISKLGSDGSGSKRIENIDTRVKCWV
jgi:hypothetical protein